MRTTLTLDDAIARELKERAHRSGLSFKRVVNETLRRGLNAQGIAEEARPYRIKPVSMGLPQDGLDLVKSRSLADRLEDEHLLEKIRLRK